jgi:hypothetical protein
VTSDKQKTISYQGQEGYCARFRLALSNYQQVAQTCGRRRVSKGAKPSLLLITRHLSLFLSLVTVSRIPGS